MNEVNRTRVKFFSAILLVILLIHVVVIAVIRSGHWSSETAATEPPAAEKNVVPEKKPEPVNRYRSPSANPNFGRPFDYSGARIGNLPEKEVPGSNGARTGILVDLDTRRVLWEKNSHQPVPIASMVKMMTMLITCEALEKNPAWSMESPVRITKTVLDVPRTGIIWLDPRETFPLSDLMKAIAIKSANDAATQVAEFIGQGSVDSFIRRMNLRATELGMTDSRFVSPCGLKDKTRGNSTSSARDMVVLAERLLEYPQIIQWCSTQVDYIRQNTPKPTQLSTTNKLINPHWPGVDGMKTGFTNDAGYCLTFTVLRDGRRLAGCVTGFQSGRDRDRFCRKLIDWGYQVSFPEQRK